jgi:hypothetical protein
LEERHCLDASVPTAFLADWLYTDDGGQPTDVQILSDGQTTEVAVVLGSSVVASASIQTPADGSTASVTVTPSGYVTPVQIQLSGASSDGTVPFKLSLFLDGQDEFDLVDPAVNPAGAAPPVVAMQFAAPTSWRPGGKPLASNPSGVIPFMTWPPPPYQPLPPPPPPQPPLLPNPYWTQKPRGSQALYVPFIPSWLSSPPQIIPNK